MTALGCKHPILSLGVKLANVIVAHALLTAVKPRPYHACHTATGTRAVSLAVIRRDDRMNSRSATSRWTLCACLIGALLPHSAGSQDAFYAGKTITIIVDGGGAYEAYARMLARHMPRYLPGRPNMIVQQMPGAGGVRAASFLYKVAPHDGTVIAGLHGAVLTAPLLNPGAADFDVGRFSWIGSVTRDTYTGYVWHTTAVQSLEDAKTKPLVVGGTSVGGNGIDMAILGRELFGLKLKIVFGYKTSAETKLALEKGEIEGTFANLLSSLKQTDWLAQGQVRIIVQHGGRRHRELPDVPLLRDLARSDEDRQILDLMGVRDEIARPYLAPPGLPDARVAMLRRAFDATLSDPEFIQDMQRQRLDIDGSLNGEQLAAAAGKIAQTAPAIVQRLAALFTQYKDAR
jgi:tripartite-type tricarboxylate transporter receptor subunit TctC